MYTAGTLNTGGTAERPGTKAKQLNIARNTCGTLQNTNGIPTEYQRNTNGIQRNTSGTPRYNGTIQYEAQL